MQTIGSRALIVKGVGTDPTGAPGTLTEVVYEDQWGQPYRDH
jgi:hypothetical protein